MKRGNLNGQMSREDYEAEEDNSADEGDDMGTFKRASAEVLATRKIIKIKRKGDSSSSGAGDQQPRVTNGTTAPYIFFGTSLAQEVKSTEPIKINSSGASLPREDSSERAKKVQKLNESFLKWASRQIETNPLSIWKEGVKDYIAHAQAIEDKYGDNSDKGHTSAASETKSAPIMAPTAAAAPFAGFNMTAKPTAPAPATAPASASSAPFSGFSFGTKPAEAATVPAPAVPASSAPFGGFTFGTKPEATAPVPAAASTATSAPFAGFSFSAKPAPAAAAAPAATTASSAPFSGFTFGTPATATAPAAPPATSFSSSFTFGGTALGGAPAAAAAMPSFGGFGASAVPAMAATAVGGVAGGEDEEGGGDEEGEPILEPEKVLRNAADTDEILHEVPCKLFSFSTADKEWKDTGKGTFRITRDPATQKQRMLVRNQVGRINFNASFFAAMKVEKVGKKLKFAAFVSVEAPALNSEGKTTTRTEMKNFMIQLKPEDLDATQRVMEAGIKASG